MVKACIKILFNKKGVLMKKMLLYVLILCMMHNLSVAHDHHKEYQQLECTIIHVNQAGSHNNDQHASHPHIPGPRTSRVPGNVATSTNWSGYAAETNFSHPAKNSVSAVSGSWIVPHLAATPDNSYCSLWVGIDGYSSSTVEQIGTEHDWHNGSQQNYAWFEMYPGGSYLISGFPLTPGD